jgi:hypothetical protein
VVESNPFNARKLQQLIQNRHKTSGLTFYYKNRPEESVTQIGLAALFNSYFNYSEGVPGVAINAWLSNIIKVEGQNIYIRKPEMPDVEMLEKMNEDWLVLVALFVQHKNINAEKLARILEITPVEAEKRIDNLSNAGILEQRVNNAFTLGRYIEPFLVKIVAEKGII